MLCCYSSLLSPSSLEWKRYQSKCQRFYIFVIYQMPSQRTTWYSSVRDLGQWLMYCCWEPRTRPSLRWETVPSQQVCWPTAAPTLPPLGEWSLYSVLSKGFPIPLCMLLAVHWWCWCEHALFACDSLLLSCDCLVTLCCDHVTGTGLCFFSTLNIKS